MFYNNRINSIEYNVIRKILPLFILISISAFTKEKIGIEYDYEITRIIDGDTVVFQADFLPLPLKRELKLRMYGIDTPEKGRRAKCPLEAEKGQAAYEYTKALVNNAKNTKIAIIKWDKYGGRVLGHVIIDGKNLAKELVMKGYALEYYGKKKRKSWCG